jgi:cytochrome P450
MSDTAAQGASAPLSFADPAVQQCPFAAYDALRDDQPVYRDPLTNNYVLTRYADVRRALMQPDALANRTGLNMTRQSTVAQEAQRRYREHGYEPIDTLVTNDPPSHRLYRSLVDKAFTTPRVHAIESGIAAIIAELIDGFVSQGECEFLSRFAVPLPMRVIAGQLGVQSGDMDAFKRWSDVSVEQVSPVLEPERELEIVDTIIEMQNYLADVIRRVRDAPEDNLISDLANADVDGRQGTMQEIIGIVHQLLVAGNETTTTTLASGMRILAQDPALLDGLRADPEQAARFAEEVLRAHSPIQTLFRKAVREVEIGGVTIPAGAIVEVRYGAANRDPERFEAPDRFDPERANASSHLAFGAGIHMCVGNQLARGELRLAFAELARRLRSVRLARGNRSVEMLDSYIAYGPRRLWIAFDCA